MLGAEVTTQLGLSAVIHARHFGSRRCNDCAQVTELLYHKQTQLEQLASERHVQQMTYERSLSAARADADRQKRCTGSWPVVFAPLNQPCTTLS